MSEVRTDGGGRVRVAIAVRPALWGELLSRALGAEPDVTVVGSAGNEPELATLIEASGPELVILDNEALGPSSEGVIARTRWAYPRVRILVLASRSGEDTVVAVLRAGAAGLVDKQASFAILLAAIRAVCAGETWANRKATARALSQLAAPRPTQEPGSPALTPRELEVVEGVGRGLRNREIAAGLGISEKTVKAHLNSIFAKLGVRNRTSLAVWVLTLEQPTT